MFGSARHMRPLQVASRLEAAADLIRRASEILTEVCCQAETETARDVQLAVRGVDEASAAALEAIAARLDAEHDAELALPLSFDTGGARPLDLPPRVRL